MAVMRCTNCEATFLTQMSGWSLRFFSLLSLTTVGLQADTSCQEIYDQGRIGKKRKPF